MTRKNILEPMNSSLKDFWMNRENWMMIIQFWHMASADGECTWAVRLSENLWGISLCPGRHMANSTVCPSKLVWKQSWQWVVQVWLTIASVLAAFNIHKSEDDTGSEEEVEAAYSDGVTRCLHTLYYFPTMLIALNSHPDFKCTLSPRSNEAIKLIQEID